MFLNFNEKPVNIIGVMDEAKRQQGEFVGSYRRRLRILLLLLPAGVLFLVLDGVVNQSYSAFTLITCVLWGAALVGWIVLRRQNPVHRETKPQGPGCFIFGRLFMIVWVLLFVGIFLWTTGLFSFFVRSPLLLVSLALGVVALVGLFRLWRHPPRSEVFGPRFDTARAIFETLKDDLAPQRTLLGWLDLTGAEQAGKMVREGTSASGATVQVYRDEWLRMKMPLCDGNLMRVSAVERIKAKRGRWKQSMRGKWKWKPAATPLSRHELRVSVTVNPGEYWLLPVQTAHSGKFLLQPPAPEGGRLVLEASSDAVVDAWDILRLLRFVYDHVEPVGVSATPADMGPPGEPVAAAGG